MKRVVIIILSIVYQYALFGQIERDIFQLAEHQVKTLKFSKHEYLNYSYLEGLIIEEDYMMPGDATIKRYYHYSNPGKLDSIVYYEIYEDTTYRSVKLYDYSPAGQLLKIQFGQNLKEEIIRIDSFSYNASGLIDTSFYLGNRTETIFGTKRIDSIRICARTNYFYDTRQRLVKTSSNSFFAADSTVLKYNDSNQLIYLKEYLGRTRSGCLLGEEEVFRETHYFYNDLGLLKKETSETFYLFPNGKIKSVNKFNTKRKYTFYDSGF